MSSGSSDPFANWRHQTGRTGVRGDYTDGAPQGHKKIAAHYAKHHRPLPSSAQQAATAPGGDATHYVRFKNQTPEENWNMDPMEVSWSGNGLQHEVVPIDVHDEMLSRGEKDPHPKKPLTGTWDREERIPVHQNRSATMRKTWQSIKVDEEHLAAARAAEAIARERTCGVSLRSLKKTAGLPFYNPPVPVMLQRGNNSSQLRAENGRRQRQMHKIRKGRGVRVAKAGVRNLDVRQWVDNLEQLTSPRMFFEYSMQEKSKNQWVNT